MKTHLNIPVAHSANVLSWDQATIDRLVEAAIGLVLRIGIQLPDDEEGKYLGEAQKRGAKIEASSRAVLFTRQHVERAIDAMRKTVPVPQPLKGPAVSQRGRAQHIEVGNGANMLFDWDSWQAKAPTSDDLVELCHWAQGSEIVDALFPPLRPKDVDPVLAPMYSYALMAKHCRKRIYPEAPTEPIQVRYLQRMVKVVEAARGFSRPLLEFEFVNPPFRMGYRSVATMLQRVDSGACSKMGVGTMTIAGISAPVTVAGAAVAALAELLSGLSLFHLLRPGYGLWACTAAGSMDLATARVCYASPHATLINLAAFDLLVRGLGVDAGCLTWYRDANEPGMQALYEFGMMQAMFSSVLARCQPEFGGLGNGSMFSPQQAMLDIEAWREFEELTDGFAVDEEMLGLEQVLAGRFEQGIHMETEHTLAHQLDGVPFSRLFKRGLSPGAEHVRERNQTQELMSWAEKAVRDAKTAGRKIEPDVGLGAELYKLVEQAAAELKTAPPPRLP